MTNFVELINALTTHIHGGKFSSIFWSGSTMSLWKIQYANFHKAYKTHIKVFLEVPRIQQRQVDDTFDVVVEIASAADGRLIKGSLKISPHFDADTTMQTRIRCRHDSLVPERNHRASALQAADHDVRRRCKRPMCAACASGRCAQAADVRCKRPMCGASGRCAPTTWT